MNVADLIARLQVFPPDTRVVLGLDFGRADVLGVFTEPVKARKVVYGPHPTRYLDARECRDDREPFVPDETAVVLAMHEPPLY